MIFSFSLRFIFFLQFDDKKIEEDLSKVQDQTCINKIKSPYQNAINWWKNKLNEQSFFSKLKKLNNYTDQQTKDWISKYKNYLSNSLFLFLVYSNIKIAILLLSKF